MLIKEECPARWRSVGIVANGFLLAFMTLAPRHSGVWR